MKIEILMIFMIFYLYCLNNSKIESNDKFFENISIVENPETMIRIIRHDRHVYKHDIWKSELLDLKVINEKSINLYAEVGYDNLMNTIVVSFRGTKYTNDKGFPDFHNILADLNIGLVEYNSLCEDCKVHKGFLKSFTLVKDRVFTAINELKNEFSCTSIVFTGHSYGGSLAVLSSITYFKTLNLLGLNDEITLLTFGQPRTGNKEFTRFINSNLSKNYRITFNKDPIVGMPPKTKNGYYHQGTEIRFTNSNFDKGSYVIMNKFEDETYNSINLFNLKYHSKYWEFIGEKMEINLKFDPDINFDD